MEKVLIKLGKSKKKFSWNDFITSDTKLIEIIAPGLEEIPDSFDTVSKLISLTLHLPKLLKLPDTFYNLQELEVLKIKNTPNLEFTKPLALPSLKILQLVSIGIDTLPDWITDCLNLDTLDLHGNNLIDLPDNFIKLQKLKRLNLDSNSFTTLPWEVEELSSLNHLSVDGNKFDGKERNRIEQKLNIKF